MKKYSSKKGFTLIELLGVIIILALLMVVIFPKIINTAKNISSETDDLNMDLIYNAANLYIESNNNDFPKKNGNTYCITLRDLTEGGYIKSPITLNNSDEDITDIKSVEVKYQNGYKLQLVNNDNCDEDITICTLKDNDSDGETSLSDKVTCGTESFYVMSLNSSTNIVTMLSEKAITLNGNPEQSDTPDYIEYPYPADDPSVYLSAINQYLSAYSNRLKSVGLSSVESRLIIVDELSTLGCDLSNWTCEAAPSWVYSFSYWTNQNGTYLNSTGSSGKGAVYYAYDGTLPVRPVVEILDSEISK